jgi:hypothetical protein
MPTFDYGDYLKLEDRPDLPFETFSHTTAFVADTMGPYFDSRVYLHFTSG